MDDKRKADIKQVVDEFRGKAVTQNLLKSYCERKGIDPGVTLTDFHSAVFQVESDEKFQALFPRIVKELGFLQYIPEFEIPERREMLKAANTGVEINIAKLFEEFAVNYLLLQNIGNEFGRMLSTTVESAGTRVYNKVYHGLLDIAKKHFGKDLSDPTALFTAKDFADYWQDRYDDYKKAPK